MKSIISSLLVSICSLSIYASEFNDWRIVCEGADTNDKLIRIYDQRENVGIRFLEFIRWNSDRSSQKLKSLVHVSNLQTREVTTFENGKRYDLVLNYLMPFTKLPSEDSFSGDEDNAEFRLVEHTSTAANSPVSEDLTIKMSCYFRNGGE